jgi:hypothetical protein
MPGFIGSHALSTVVGSAKLFGSKSLALTGVGWDSLVVDSVADLPPHAGVATRSAIPAETSKRLRRRI